MVIGGIGFSTSSTTSPSTTTTTTFPITKFCKVTAFGGSFPFLVSLVRVLVGDVWRFGTTGLVVVMVVLRMGHAGVSVVVMVVVVVVTI